MDLGLNNKPKILCILCLLALLGLQTNLTALVLSFEENHQVSFTKMGSESFLVLTHSINDSKEFSEFHGIHAENTKGDHFIKLENSESYREDSSSASRFIKNQLQLNQEVLLSLFHLKYLPISLERLYFKSSLNPAQDKPVKNNVLQLSESTFLRL